MIEGLSDNIINFLGYLGKYGPVILFFVSLYLLFDKQNLLYYYIVGFFINSILNLILKGIFQQPRPSEEDPKMFKLALKNANKTIFKDGIPFNIFGMPSGHSQSVLFSTVYIYFALLQNHITIFYLILSGISVAQRTIYKYHTIFQIIVGAITGSLVGYTVFYLAQQNIGGLIREKPDDNGPI